MATVHILKRFQALVSAGWCSIWLAIGSCIIGRYRLTCASLHQYASCPAVVTGCDHAYLHDLHPELVTPAMGRCEALDTMAS